MLIPLYWVLVMLGSMLGLSPDHVSDKHVYYSATAAHDGSLATACEGVTYARLCRAAGVPEKTIVLYPYSWRSDEATQRYIVRHEVEHLLRVEGHASGSTFDEESVALTACSFAWSAWFCDPDWIDK